MISGLRHSKDARGQDIDLSALEGLISGVVRQWSPVEIWLFGSRARGYASPESDWDLLVVAPDDAEVDDPLTGWRLRKEFGVRADVIPCRISEFRDARNVPNTLAFEAAHHGVLIFEL